MAKALFLSSLNLDDILKEVFIKFLFSEHIDFKKVRRLLIIFVLSDKRCLKDFRNILQLWMMDNVIQSLKPDMTKANVFMPVLSRSNRIFAVINMKNL